MMSLSEWRFSLEVAWDDPWFRWQSVATCVLFVLATTYMLTQLVPLGLHNSELIFHYNLYIGIDEIHEWWYILIVPVVVAAVLGVNLAGSFLTFRHDRIASRIFLCSATAFAVLAALGGALLTSVNG